MEVGFHNNFVRNVLTNSETNNTVLSPESSSSLFHSTLEGFDDLTRSFFLGNFKWFDENFTKSCDLYDHKFINKTTVSIRKEVKLPKEIKDTFESKFGCDVIVLDKSPDPSDIKGWINENIGDVNCDIFTKPNINNTLSSIFKWHESLQTNTCNKKFQNENESVDKEFIEINGKLGFGESENLDAKIIEIPLANENFKTLLLVPNKKDGLKDLEYRLSEYDLKELMEKIEHHQMKVSFPKVNIQQELDLKDLFYKMNNRQYPYKFGRTDTCHVSRMKTITSMKITETDIKAAAVTACELLLDPLTKEIIYQTTIANRFAKTLITNKVENLENVSQETTFSVVLPEEAFITEFVMKIQGKSYKSYIKEKEEAKDIYDQAVSSGRSAAHVAVSARDSNKFTVSVNLEPLSEITFLLTYEELLQRRYDQYELVLNIQPGKLVNVLKCEVKINESKKLKFVKTPSIRSGNEVTDKEEANPLSKIEMSDSTGLIKFEPDLDNQMQIARKLGSEETKGITGQFVVQYDVELDTNNGEILISDGYFVHFYAPDDLPPLPKHVVFALDTSGSMGGRKIEQLKDAMKCILDQIKVNDLIDILEFTTNVSVHDSGSDAVVVIDYGNEENYHEPFYKYERINFPTAKPATREIIERAKNHVNRMNATESTHAIGGLETALFLVKRGQEQYSSHQPMVIFLTDGMPNAGVSDTDEITKIVTKLNQNNNKAPIFSLSFGEGADKSFLRKISLANFGFARHIYEAADASLQLQQFYKQISSPLLSNVTFKYDSNVEDVTRTVFPIYFRGGDLVVCGRYTESSVPKTINLCRPDGCIPLKPVVKKSVTQIERLWAYLTVKQLLEQKENAEGEDKKKITKTALDLALKYSFVTEVTSLVVVKPDESSVTDTESASGEPGEQAYFGGGMVMDLRGPMMPMMRCFAMSKSRNACMPMACAPMACASLQVCEGAFTEDIETAVPPPTAPSEFSVDYPFLIMIQYKINNKCVILFLGKISQIV